ncbi:MAG TPA: hypothetical protein VIR63_01630 [Pontiella sp.]
MTIEALSPTTWLILISAGLIIGLVLCAKAIKLIVKLAVITVMLLFAVYFLRQSGIL